MSFFKDSKIWPALCVALLACGIAAAQAEDDGSEARVYTNADLASLPAPGNDELPSLEEEEQAGATADAAKPAAEAAKPAAGAKPAATPPAADEKSIEWLQGRIDRMKLDQAIETARRRLANASAEVAKLQSPTRPEGSAFSDSKESADSRYSRDVADDQSPQRSALEKALSEESAARAELDRLLRQSSGG